MEKILDLSKVPKEVLLILEFLKKESEIATQKKLAKEVDWQLFMDYTVHHRVYPLLYQKLSKFEEPLVPDFVLERLKQLYRKNTLKMLQLTGEMNSINELLYRNSIQVIFLKGPLLAKELYGDISLRTSGDLDFLISVEQLDATERLLINQGYIKKNIFNPFLNDRKIMGYHDTFIHPTKKTTLEVHWRLHPRPSKDINLSKLWKRKKVNQLSSTPIYYLGEQDLFHYLIIHGSRHGWYRLRWLVDIQKLLWTCPDLNKYYQFSKKNNYNLQFNQALILLSELLDLNLKNKKYILFKNDSKILAQKTIFYLERKENLHSPNVSVEIKNFYLQYTSSNFTFYNKLYRIIIKFYPTSSDLKTLKLPKYIFFMYFPLRPFLVVYRKIKKPFVGNLK